MHNRVNFYKLKLNIVAIYII